MEAKVEKGLGKYGACNVMFQGVVGVVAGAAEEASSRSSTLKSCRGAPGVRERLKNSGRPCYRKFVQETLSWLKIVNWGSNAEEVGPSVNGVVEVVWIKFGDEEVVNVSLKFEFGSMVVAINVIIKFRFELDYEGRKEF